MELIELAKQHGWQIFDTGLGSMLDLENPANIGSDNHGNYVDHLMKKSKE